MKTNVDAALAPATAPVPASGIQYNFDDETCVNNATKLGSFGSNAFVTAYGKCLEDTTSAPATAAFVGPPAPAPTARAQAQRDNLADIEKATSDFDGYCSEKYERYDRLNGTNAQSNCYENLMARWRVNPTQAYSLLNQQRDPAGNIVVEPTIPLSDPGRRVAPAAPAARAAPAAPKPQTRAPTAAQTQIDDNAYQRAVKYCTDKFKNEGRSLIVSEEEINDCYIQEERRFGGSVGVEPATFSAYQWYGTGEQCAEWYPDDAGVYFKCVQGGNQGLTISAVNAQGYQAQLDACGSDNNCRNNVIDRMNSDGLKEQDDRIRAKMDADYARDLKSLCKNDPECIEREMEAQDDQGVQGIFWPDASREAKKLQQGQQQAFESNFVSGGIYDSSGNFLQQRDPNGPTADYAPTFKTGWFGGWWDRVILQIPETTQTAQQAPARIEERWAPTPRPYTRAREDAISRITITAEDDTGSSPCHTGFWSFLNGVTNNCVNGNSAPASQYRAYVDPSIEYKTLGDGSTVLISTTDDGSSGGPVYDPFQIEEENPAGVVATPLLNRPPIVAYPIDEIPSTDDYDYSWWASPSIQRVTDTEGLEVDWTEYYGGDESFYPGANRQFSTAVPFSDELFNQSLVAGAFGAFFTGWSYDK